MDFRAQVSSVSNRGATRSSLVTLHSLCTPHNLGCVWGPVLLLNWPETGGMGITAVIARLGLSSALKKALRSKQVICASSARLGVSCWHAGSSLEPSFLDPDLGMRIVATPHSQSALSCWGVGPHAAGPKAVMAHTASAQGVCMGLDVAHKAKDIVWTMPDSAPKHTCSRMTARTSDAVRAMEMT